MSVAGWPCCMVIGAGMSLLWTEAVYLLTCFLLLHSVRANTDVRVISKCPKRLVLDTGEQTGLDRSLVAEPAHKATRSPRPGLVEPLVMKWVMLVMKEVVLSCHLGLRRPWGSPPPPRRLRCNIGHPMVINRLSCCCVRVLSCRAPTWQGGGVRLLPHQLIARGRGSSGKAVVTPARPLHPPGCRHCCVCCAAWPARVRCLARDVLCRCAPWPESALAGPYVELLGRAQQL